MMKKMNELENLIIETILNESQSKKVTGEKQIEQSINDLWENIKWPNRTHM